MNGLRRLAGFLSLKPLISYIDLLLNELKVLYSTNLFDESVAYPDPSLKGPGFECLVPGGVSITASAVEAVA